MSVSQIHRLADALRVPDRQRRIGDGQHVVAIAGVRGIARADGADIVVTTRDAHALAELIDVGIIRRLAGADIFVLRRHPTDELEAEMLATALGIARTRKT